VGRLIQAPDVLPDRQSRERKGYFSERGIEKQLHLGWKREGEKVKGLITVLFCCGCESQG
jgi:hypothetical protein